MELLLLDFYGLARSTAAAVATTLVDVDHFSISSKGITKENNKTQQQWPTFAKWTCTSANATKSRSDWAKAYVSNYDLLAVPISHLIDSTSVRGRFPFPCDLITGIGLDPSGPSLSVYLSLFLLAKKKEAKFVGDEMFF